MKKTKGPVPASPPPVAETAPDPDDGPPEPKKPKTATGKRPRPDAKGRPQGARRAGPAPEPPKKNAFDYLLAVVGPIVCAGTGTLAFLMIKKSLERLFANALVRDLVNNPDVEIQKEILPKLATFVPFIPHSVQWAPIVFGAIMGIAGALCLLKMTPGMGSRLTALCLMLPGVLVPLVLFLEGRFISQWLESQVRDRYFKVVRGGKVDPRALDFKCDDLPLRKFQSLWKVDLEEGDIPAAWLFNLDEITPNPKDTSIPKEEKNIRSIDLKEALKEARDFVKDEKYKADFEPILKKLEDIRDRVNDPLQTTTETERKEMAGLEDMWLGFERKTEKEKAFSMPDGPKDAKWFKGFKTFGEAGIGLGTTKADRALVTKVYLGKAVHAAVPASLSLPAEMRYAAAYYAAVDENFVGKDDTEKTLTKYFYVFYCYDLEKPENPPILIPQVKGILDEARFQVEVVGAK
ncbi:hypothetical protein HY251_08150 [bacterium]|nr:hypothetical protein [bacterium]